MREKDYEFYANAKYGDNIDIKSFLMLELEMHYCLCGIYICIFNEMKFINFILSLLVGFAVFKLPYISLKSYYKRHLYEIDEALPYYLKNIRDFNSTLYCSYSINEISG
jgi:hypothetical protein